MTVLLLSVPLSKIGGHEECEKAVRKMSSAFLSSKYLLSLGMPASLSVEC